VDSPEVGNNLDDQFAILAFAEEGTELVPQSPNDGYGLLFWNTQDDPSLPPNMAMNLAADAGVAVFVYFTVYLHSRGTVTLVSTDPAVPVEINPNYLSSQIDYDNLATMLEQGLALIPLMGLNETFQPCAGNDCSTPLKQLNTYIGNGTLLGAVPSISPGYHFTGTAGIGKVIDPFTMGVYGTRGLYVVDGSALVRTDAQNTQNPVYAVSERGIHFVIGDCVEKCFWN